MNPLFGWALAVIAVAVGYVSWGWQGVVLAVSVVVFWLLLQFSRALRVMRQAAERPVGHVDNAVMLQARLKPGLLMMDILKLTRSLGQKVVDEPETWVWTDGGGDRVRVEMRDGRSATVVLERATSTA
jgi:uncharacterized protein (DUF58 family)